MRVISVRRSGSCARLDTRNSTNKTRSKAMIVGIIVKEIERRMTDRGFRLQTGCVVRGFSCGEADDEGLPAYGESRATEQMDKCLC
jgi:hypothetical protein